MTLLRAARPGRRGPAAAALIVALALAAGCGGDPAAPSAPGSDVPTVAPVTAAPAGEPSPSEEPTEDPSPTDEPASTDEAASTATPLPTPRLTATPGSTAACTGNAENRAFYAAVAGQVAWDVYCPVLPAGWFVDAGTFRLAGGGRMEIAYNGPARARLEIRQGAYCGDGATCAPTGSDAGSAAFGDRPARLFDVGDGRWLVVAESGEVLWEVRSSGIDRDTATAHAAAFTRVSR